MAAQWYVLKSKPNKEDALYRQAVSRNLDVYYPRFAVRRVNPRARKMVPFFPSYMFIRVDLAAVGLSTFQWMPYAVGLVSFDGEPATIMDNMMEVLRRNLEILQKRATQQLAGLQPGSALIISDGPFAGYEAIFDTRLPGEDRIRILLNISRGKRVSLQLPSSQVRIKDK